jgi:hypothetical protein
MKKLKCLAIIAATMASLNGYSQGTISFVNSSATAIINSLTGLPSEANVLVVGLYFNANPSAEANPGATSDGFQLAPSTAGSLAPTAVRNGGTFLGGTKEVPGVPALQQASFQVRAWSVGFATFEEAFAAGMTDTSILVGYSDVLRFAPGGPAGTPNPAAGLVADGGFTGLTVRPVPEPSMIALSVLGGLGAMLLIRRRR